ncbi:methylesterase 10-like isoform X2 [Nicotiana tabacum]|uniref:Methylesterase 10-like isoform X2 n=2 Tax=Nicotiana tabacum TaxID=4097 RepID=A0AC58TMD1_TOBAC
MEKIVKKHFVLVHGFCLGAWCWYKLVNLLQKIDHKVTALDLGASGINMKQLKEIVSITDYVQPLMDFMVSLPHDEKVILVGHSYGGLCISLAMEAFPQKISAAVFITAYMPNHKDPPALLIQEDLELAKMLIRPGKFFTEDMSKEGLLTQEKYGSVRRVYVLCHDDPVMEEEFQMYNIQKSPPHEVKYIAKAGHMVMISQPLKLSLCLQEIADNYH